MQRFEHKLCYQLKNKDYSCSICFNTLQQTILAVAYMLPIIYIILKNNTVIFFGRAHDTWGETMSPSRAGCYLWYFPRYARVITTLMHIYRARSIYDEFDTFHIFSCTVYNGSGSKTEILSSYFNVYSCYPVNVLLKTLQDCKPMFYITGYAVYCGTNRKLFPYLFRIFLFVYFTLHSDSSG